MRSTKALAAILFLLSFCLCFFGCTEYFDEESGIYDETYIPPFVSTAEITETETTANISTDETTEALPETEESTTTDTEKITIVDTEEITISETEPVTTAEAKDDSETVPTSEESEITDITEKDSEKPDEEKQEYLLNTNTKKFHLLTCKSGQKTKEENRAYHKGTRDEIIAQGYSPCKNCNP